jgi:tetratricopeptide (TPR) repeat protein
MTLAEISPVVAEYLQEAAECLGVDGFAALSSSLVIAAGVFLPLIFILHWNARLALAGKRVAGGPAAERNQAGYALIQQGGYVAAVVELTEALRINPRLAAAHVNRGVAYHHLGKADEAIADFDAALCLSPALVEALSWRGQVWFGKGDYDKALADHDEALRHQPQHRETLVGRAMVWIHKGNYDRALDDLNLAIALGATAAGNFSARAGILLAKGDHDAALADCTEAIRRGDTDAYCNRGMAWLGKGDCDRAIADFDEAIRLDPAYGLAYNNRGAAYMRRHEYARAAADFREAMRLSPQLPNSYKNLAWLQATCPEAEFRDGVAAVANTRKALDLVEHKVAEWIEILAAAHAEAGDFEEAVKWQTECLQQAPADLKAKLEAHLEGYKARQPLRIS